MKDSILIQRLDPPFLGMGEMLDNPFSFGGGLRNGGLSPDAMDLLRPIFSFDYMGAAEFEFGAVPKAFQQIAETAAEENLIAWSFVEPRYGTRIYAIGSRLCRDEIQKRILHDADDRAKPRPRRKEPTHLSIVVKPEAERDAYSPRTRGWLELDNGFMFFVSQEMFEATADVRGDRRPLRSSNRGDGLMHSTHFDIDEFHYDVHHNGDYSGDVIISKRPAEYDMETWPKDVEEIRVPFEVLRDLVANKVRSDAVALLEDMSADEIFSGVVVAGVSP